MASADGAEGGALIVFERKTGLNDYIEKGVRIDAVVQQETMVSIFLPESPLHDGAVIIQEGRIAAAGCLPLDATIEISGTFGTRRRLRLEPLQGDRRGGDYYFGGAEHHCPGP